MLLIWHSAKAVVVVVVIAAVVVVVLAGTVVVVTAGVVVVVVVLLPPPPPWPPLVVVVVVVGCTVEVVVGAGAVMANAPVQVIVSRLVVAITSQAPKGASEAMVIFATVWVIEFTIGVSLTVI